MHKILGLILAVVLVPITLALPPLTQATSSLGAVELDGYLYVYGGHAGKTHKYNTETVLGTFQRLKLEVKPKMKIIAAKVCFSMGFSGGEVIGLV